MTTQAFSITLRSGGKAVTAYATYRPDAATDHYGEPGPDGMVDIFGDRRRDHVEYSATASTLEDAAATTASMAAGWLLDDIENEPAEPVEARAQAMLEQQASR